MKSLPAVRQESLVVRELSDEVLIYDLDRDKAHCLNPTAAFVWKRCDGRTTIAALQSAFREEFGGGNESMLWLALEQLEKFDLLQERVRRPAGMKRVSRRTAMRSMGIAAVVGVPLITTIIAPTVQAVVSCQPEGHACGNDNQCCSQNCNAGSCGPVL